MTAENKVQTLDKLPVGQSAVITAVGGEGALRRRLLDMGLTPRTLVSVRRAAPMGDPIELTLRGYELTLRLHDAAEISIIPVSDCAGAENGYESGSCDCSACRSCSKCGARSTNEPEKGRKQK